MVLWLQGGPGASGSGYGNFEELGPLDSDLKPRNTSWVQAANVIFIDSPVGAGFSYVDNDAAYVTTDEQVGADLVTLFTNITQRIPELQTSPFWIFCESYGGKETISFATALVAAISAGTLKMNFKGFAIGDSWVSPIDFVDTWAPFLRSLSVMDEHQKTTVVDPDVAACDAAVAAGQWTAATNAWGRVESDVSRTTDDIDFCASCAVRAGAVRAGARARHRTPPPPATPSPTQTTCCCTTRRTPCPRTRPPPTACLRPQRPSRRPASTATSSRSCTRTTSRASAPTSTRS